MAWEIVECWNFINHSLVVVVVVRVLTKKIKLSMQSKYFAHQTPQSKTIFVVLEILKAVPPYGSRTAKKEIENERER